MTLINCCENCVYQNEGFCSLDSISRVTNLSPTGCIHMLERSDRQAAGPVTPEKIQNGYRISSKFNAQS